MHEIKKIYDLDFLEDEQVEPRIIGRTESLAFSTGRFAIKFIQNLCEGHNRTYQKKFFEFEFDKDEYLKDNRNIYIEGRNKNANSTYFNFIKLSRKSFQKQLELSNKNEEEKPKKTDKKKLKDILSFQQNSIPEKEKKERKEIPTDPLQLKDTIETVASNQQTQTIEQEDKELEQSLDNTQVSFFNLISYMLAMVNKNFHAGNTLDCILFQNVIKFKNLENLSELYSRLSDLIVEMIQGTDIENFKKFYSSGLPKAYRYFSVEGDYVPNKDLFVTI